jgi:hypothetical protein
VTPDRRVADAPTATGERRRRIGLSALTYRGRAGDSCGTVDEEWSTLGIPPRQQYVRGNRRIGGRPGRRPSGRLRKVMRDELRRAEPAL